MKTVLQDMEWRDLRTPGTRITVGLFFQGL